MIILAIVSTIIVGYLAGVYGYTVNSPELGSIFAIATMGGFILFEIRKSNRSK